MEVMNRLPQQMIEINLFNESKRLIGNRMENARLLAVYVQSLNYEILRAYARPRSDDQYSLRQEHYVVGEINLYADVAPWVLEQVMNFIKGQELEWSADVVKEVTKFHSKYPITGLSEHLDKAGSSRV